MKKRITKATATISIATLVVVFVVAIGGILLSNYLKNQQLPKTIPIHSQAIQLANRLTNSATIDKPYLIDSAASLKQTLKLTSLAGFSPAEQVLVGVVVAGKPNAGYTVSLDKTSVRDNLVYIDYRINQPEAGKQYASVITYPKLFSTFNRTDLPNFNSVNFVFTNLTDGATQTITKQLGE